MSGQINVVRTKDWLTPFRVETRPDGGDVKVARFQSAARAQTYAVATAEQTGFTLVYADEKDVLVSDESTSVESCEASTSREPRRVSLEDFKARCPKVCAKCRRSKPLAQYRELTHTNATDGRVVMHGYASRCHDCDQAAV